MHCYSICKPNWITLGLLVVLTLTFTRAGCGQTDLSVSFSAQGLQTVAYKQVLLEDTSAYPADTFHIWHMKATDLAGNVLTSGQQSWGESNNGKSWDSSAHAWTYQFNWGSIRAQYIQRGNTLDTVVTTTNNAGSGLIFDGASIFPLVLHPPQLPVGFVNASYNWFGDNTSSPSVTTADYGSGQVSVMVPDASRPLYSGFQSTVGGYSVLMSSTSPDSLATFLPHNDRPIQPGQTDTYTVSLRFAPSGTNTASLAADVYQSWTATYPSTLNWNDRRAIGTVYLASSPTGDKTQPQGYPNNPRRYFGDSNASDFDVRTTTGLAAFQRLVLQQAQANVTNLKRLNAQGAITWDIEGEQYPQDTSYVCSPDQVATVAPEMESVVQDSTSPYVGMKLDDAYFRTMTDAGLRVGVCVRPQQFAINANGTAQQTTLNSSAVAAQLLRKMRYAHDRWGVTLFYLDSTVDALGGTLDASILELAAAGLPDSLLIPEETTNRHYASVAPFKSFIFHGDLGTDRTVYNYYPTAFSVNLVNDVDPARLAAAQAQLTQAVRMGDILMAHVDYWQANNPLIVAIYQAAGVWTNPVTSPAPKNTTLHLTSPAASVIFGKPLVETASLAPAAATGVVNFYDGALVLGSAAVSNGTALFSTSSLGVGTHFLTAVYAGSASYAASTAGSLTVTVTAVPTTLSLTESAASATVGNMITFTASVSNAATGSVTFYDGLSSLGAASLSAGTASIPVSTLAVGTHSIHAAYTGTAGFASSTSNIMPETITPPITTSISLATSAGSVVLGYPLTLTATLIPTVATGSITFYDGTSVLGSTVLSSGVARLTTSTLSVGTHSLTAVYSGAMAYAASTAQRATVVVTTVVTGTPATANLLDDPGFELQQSGTILSPWIVTGPSAHGVDVGSGNSHSGANNAFIWDASSNWNAISQEVAVQPNREYVFSGWVRNALAANVGYFSVLGSQGVLSEANFGNLPGYTKLLIRFNSGINTTLTLRVGFWGVNTAQWLQIDDLSLRPNLLKNPGFELQSTSSLLSPWTGVGSSTQGVEIGLGNAHTGTNDGYVRDASGTWNGIEQVVAVAPNMSYLLTGWIRNSLTSNAGMLGVDGLGSVLGQTVFGTFSNYTMVSVAFNSGPNVYIMVKAGFLGQLTPRWMQIDDLTLEQVP